MASRLLLWYHIFVSHASLTCPDDPPRSDTNITKVLHLNMRNMMCDIHPFLNYCKDLQFLKAHMHGQGHAVHVLLLPAAY
jgi:hypothetical protein